MACAGPSDQAPAPLRVEFWGCAVVRSGPICALGGERRLRLWIAGGAEARITTDGVPAPATATPTPGGRRYEVEVPPGARRLVVASSDGQWTLPLEEDWAGAVLAPARAARGAGDAEGAAARLDALLACPLPPALEARALGLRARVATDLGDDADGVALLLAAIGEADAAGLLSEVSGNAFALSHALLVDQGRRLADARAVLDAFAERIEAVADDRARLPYYRGILAEQSADHRGALRGFEAAVRDAERLGLDRVARMAGRRRAFVLRALGRDAEAARLLDAHLADPPPDLGECERGNLLNAAASLALLPFVDDADHADTESLARAESWFRQAQAIFRSSCPRPPAAVGAATGIAEVALARGAPDEARRLLRQLRAPDPTSRDRDALWHLDWRDLQGRIALAAGDPLAAAADFEALDRLAAEASMPEARWRAAVGRARAAELAGDPEAALAAYALAEAWLDRLSLRVPLGDGRADFLHRHDGSTRRAVELLLQLGRDAEAFAVARHARARLLLGLQWTSRIEVLPPERRRRWDDVIERYRDGRNGLEASLAEAWRLSADEARRARDAREHLREDLDHALDEALAVLAEAVPAPQPTATESPGQLSLHYFPLPDGSWAGFVRHGGRVAARRLGVIDVAAPREVLAARLLEPFREEITAARSLRVVPYGSLREVDFHALPWDGDILLAARDVVYGLDLTSATPPGGAGTRALVVADPRGDLPGARADSRAVAEALRDRGVTTELLDGPALAGDAAATAERVRAALGRASFFYYAGHGEADAADGWASVLRTADGGVTAGDVLTLPVVPPLVALSGCDTARSPGEADVETLGLAQAFVMRGSRTVLATARVLPDDVRLGAALIGDSPPTTPEALADRSREVLLRLRRDTPGTDWAAFRVIVP